MRDAWSFCRAEEYWNLYRPFTPWGKDAREARTVHTDSLVIIKLHDDIDAAASLLRRLGSDSVALERTSYHLKRMPRIPLGEKPEYEFLELFQLKKFLANYRGLLHLLPSEAASYFGLQKACPELCRELGRGGSDAETFYIADSYHPKLMDLRTKIAEIDKGLRKSRETLEEWAKKENGFTFDGRDFLVVPKASIAELAVLASHYSIEPYDDFAYIIRLLPSPDMLEAKARFDKMLSDERLLEQEVILRLSLLCSASMPELRAAVSAVTRLDLARAGAVLARETGGTRPVLDSAALSFDTARLYPCEQECRSLAFSYTPLTSNFTANSVVLFGSNMGGKTVVLKTVLFLQLLAQAGLFVPAKRFESRVYANIEYIGELAGERLAGLSGFGFEVWRLQEAWSRRADSLVAFDELARTTGSREAEALLSAVIEAYASCAGSRAFFATHFRGVARIPEAEYWRMKGLDHDGASECLDADAPLPQRLAGINGHMRYELETDLSSAHGQSDALAIASMLGLEPDLVRRAREFYRS